jgi:hypothetical protein
MAESVLAATPPPLFGALYASNKAQLVARGTGPIVPMVEPGDVGVLCLVQRSAVGDIPTVGGEEMRRRIRLEAVAVGRFVIDRVLHSGYGGGLATTQPPLPYIVAETELVFDVKSFRSDSDASNSERSTNLYGSRSDEDLCLANLLETLQESLPGIQIPVTDYRRELQSFALAAAALSETESMERLECLLSQDTASRLKRYTKK